MSNGKRKISMDQVDKLTESYTFRLPEITKLKTDNLSSAWKKKLNEALLHTTAKILHDSEFDPSKYLSSE